RHSAPDEEGLVTAVARDCHDSHPDDSAAAHGRSISRCRGRLAGRHPPDPGGRWRPHSGDLVAKCALAAAVAITAGNRETVPGFDRRLRGQLPDATPSWRAR